MDRWIVDSDTDLLIHGLTMCTLVSGQCHTSHEKNEHIELDLSKESDKDTNACFSASAL